MPFYKKKTIEHGDDLATLKAAQIINSISYVILEILISD